MPSRTGIRMSMSTTSGSSRAAWRTASAPSTASPTTSVPGSNPRILRSPTRTSAWSSAISTRGTAGSAGREQDVEDEAAVGALAGLELAAVQGHPLPDAHEPVPAARQGGGRADAVVGDLQLHRPGPVPDPHPHRGGLRVLERVGQALLHDPVGRQLDADRQLPAVALDPQL